MVTAQRKILFIGLGGAGKTTALGKLDRSAYFLGEGERDPTDAEKAAWDHIPKKVSTSRIPNFGQVVFRRSDGGVTHIPQDQFDGKLQTEDILVHVFDMCGQREFFPFIEEYSIGTDGLLFIVDGSRDLSIHCEEIHTAYLTVKAYFEKRGDPFPPTVFVANKMDIIQRRKIAQGAFKKHIFLRTILNSYQPEDVFNRMGFVPASALEGWGIVEALEMLLQYILYLKPQSVGVEQ